jgi:hypothetical protein
VEGEPFVNVLIVSMLGFAAAGLLLALVLRSAQLVQRGGHVTVIALAWPVGMLAFHLLGGPFIGLSYIAGGFAGGAATFWALSRPS